jgi:hypothetical protein
MIERCRNVLCKQSARDGAAAVHHFDQPDCHVAEHRDIGVSRAGKSD